MGYVGQAPAAAAVTSADITDLAIVNADVNASAAIDYSKLAALSDGNILVGNGSNVAVSVNPSGDVDVSNAGVFSIASDSVVNADVKSDAAIAISKLATITLSTNTSGDYVQNITAGTGLTSTGATSGENIAHSLSVDASQTGITSVGALDAGSITSNFGNIDTGSGTIDTTGAVSTGALSPAGDLAIADAKYIKLGAARMATIEPNANQTGYGVVVGFDSAGSVSLGDAVFINTSGKVAQANAVTGSVTNPAIGIALNAGGSDGDDVYVLTHGVWRNDDEDFSSSVGSPVYLGESVGAITKTAPSTDGDYVQRLGIAISDDCMLVMPSIDVIEHA
jgi:hypothetical protein